MRWDIEISDVVQKLADSGRSLVSVPMRDLDLNVEHPFYIAGDAVYYISGALIEKDRYGLTIGIEGFDQFESNSVTKEEVETLVLTVRASKQMLEYMPEFAYARWRNKSRGLYIDPTFVVKAASVQEQSQVDVTFKGHETLQVQIWNEQPVHTIRLMAPEEDDEQIYQDAIKAAKIKTAEFREQFFDDLIAHNPSLVRVPGNGIYCFDPSDISFVCANGKGMTANGKGMTVYSVKEVGENFPIYTSVFFNDAAERKKATEILARAQKPDAKPPQPKG